MLNATIRHYIKSFESTHPEVTSRLMRSVYVDDIIFGADNDETAYQLFMDSKELLKKGGFKKIYDKQLRPSGED